MGLSTVQKCQKVVAMKGRHQVGAMTSGERCTNTTGVYQCIRSVLTPNEDLQTKEDGRGAQAGTIFHCNDSGLMELKPELSSIITTVGGWTPVASTSGQDGAPARTIFHYNDSGWMDTGGFNIWQGWSSSQNYLPL